jgi:hypothetical protein
VVAGQADRVARAIDEGARRIDELSPRVRQAEPAGVLARLFVQAPLAELAFPRELRHRRLLLAT